MSGKRMSDVELAREFKDRLLLQRIVPVEREPGETALEYANRLLEQLEDA